MMNMADLLAHQGRSPVLRRDVCIHCDHPFVAQSEAAFHAARAWIIWIT